MQNRYLEIIQEPSYWVEQVNNTMYDAMVTYMGKNNLNQTQFAEYLGISKGRLSQILNSREINFRIEKLFSIALKISEIPQITFQEKDHHQENMNKIYSQKAFPTYNQNILDKTS